MGIGNPVFDVGESGGGGTFSNVSSLQVTIPGDGSETSFYIPVPFELTDPVILESSRSSFNPDAPDFGSSYRSLEDAFVFEFESAPSGDIGISVVIGSASSATFDTTTANAGDPPGGPA